jgi:signal transduction histidine kinase
MAVLYAALAVVLAVVVYAVLRVPGLAEPLALLMVGLVALLALHTFLLLRENRGLFANFTATDAFKTQLLRFISHEIANPLSPLKVQLTLLRQGVAADLQRAWAAVDRSIGRLESLSRDVRLMALVETHRLVQSTTVADIVPRVTAAVQAHQAVAAQRGVRLAGDLPAYPMAVPIDGERFDQVVDNLLSNALKFTPSGGTVGVRLWRAPGGVAVLEVKDSGAGMSPEQQARLFSAFGRPQGSTTPGLGLGLYLCKAIVEGHEGHISATSEGPGKGAAFRVELPAAPEGPRARAVGPPPAYRPAGHDPSEVPEGRPPDLPV